MECGNQGSEHNPSGLCCYQAVDSVAILTSVEDTEAYGKSPATPSRRRSRENDGLLDTPVAKYSDALKYSLTGLFYVVAIVLSVVAIMYRSPTSSSSSVIQSTPYGAVDVYSGNFTVVSADIGITVSSPDYGVLPATADLPWDAVAEIYKDQVITINANYVTDSGATIPVDNEEYEVTWNIFGQTYSGLSPTFQITPSSPVAAPGVSTCSVSVRRGDNVAFSREFTMAVKYIRREIRSLTEEDRQKFFSALKILYSTDLETGIATYGDKFRTAEQFLYKHLNGAGRTDCDHWHDGAGIVVIHMAFTLEAEQALQAVDPTIAMPYWDYSKDGYDYPDNWWETAVFQEDWFGEAVPPTEDHSISKGYWSTITLPDGEKYKETWDITTEKSVNPFVNAYGVMRSAWNNNPTNHISRRNTTYGKSLMSLPSCEFIHGCYASSTMEKIHDCLNDATHGPVHIMIGGTWGGEDMFEKVRVVDFLQGPDRLIFFKNLWRMGFSRCPTSCTPGDRCACAVPDVYIDTYGPQYILEYAGIYDMIKDKLHDNSDETLIKVIRALEDPGVAGDMFSSASSFDPSFWVVHGTLERILSLKRARLQTNPERTFDETWGFSTANTRYLVGICDWSAITDTQNDLTLPACNMDPAAICDGHNEDDVMEFGDFLGQGETYTNRQFYDFIHPWNEQLPYVYDKYTFDHCEALGFEF